MPLRSAMAPGPKENQIGSITAAAGGLAPNCFWIQTRPFGICGAGCTAVCVGPAPIPASVRARTYLKLL